MHVPVVATADADARVMVLRAFDPRHLRTMAMRENDYLLTALFFAGMMLVAGVLRLQRSARVPHAARLVGQLRP